MVDVLALADDQPHRDWSVIRELLATAEISNEDSSSTMTMFGRLAPGTHSVSGGAARADPIMFGGSASIQPVDVRCDTDTTPDRARFEM